MVQAGNDCVHVMYYSKTRIVDDVLLGLVNRLIRDSSVCCVRFYYVKPFMLLRMLPYAGPTEIGKSKNQP